MKPIALFPFLCVSLLLAGCGREAEQERQRLAKEVESLRTELDAAKTERTNLQNETARLRKDNEDLLRLRNEIRQLRDDKNQLAQKAQAAQSEIVRAQSQAQAAQAQAAQAQAQAQTAQAQALASGTNAAQSLTPEQQAFAARYGLNNPQSVAQANACFNNLNQIETAKLQWALDKRKTDATIPTTQDLAAYLKEGIPKCPAGGTYTLNAVGAHVTCSIPGHALAP